MCKTNFFTFSFHVLFFLLNSVYLKNGLTLTFCTVLYDRSTKGAFTKKEQTFTNGCFHNGT